MLTDSMKILASGRLIKIDSHKIEYLLINLFLAIQSVILIKKEFFHSMGIKIDDILGSIQNFSEAVLPAYRKKREYLLSIFAKHEVNSNNPYNKKLFKRIARGNYLLNPELQIMYNDKWISLRSIIENQDVSAEEIREHSFAKQKKIYDEYQKKIEEAKKRRERERERERERDRDRDRWRL